MNRDAGDPLESFFGPLEIRVLDALWRRERSASVGDLASEFAPTAYTTLMTTLERLRRKGVLVRAREGRAFLYEPRWSRAELTERLASRTLGAWLEHPTAAQPILSSFIDAVSSRDERLLDELDRLIRQKRRELSR
ncbi:MAG TPA: BlaI/MecI/CopY family transcriptional regulator [Vicinamibacterales bacterium]|nr:BlaI/MecI/CopY family transcriptional regulator [Vicinamibacterales bacterium]